MQLITLKNELLTIEINPLGAEIFSIKDYTGREILWQGDPAYWNGRALNPFPLIGRLYESRYTYNGKSYDMPIHGFASSSLFTADKKGDTEAVFTLVDNETTRECFPFSFRFSIEYRLQNNELSVLFIVDNTDDNILYYGLGGHPGFNVPLCEGLKFEDYYLEFSSDGATRVDMSDKALVLKDDYPCAEMVGGRIPLSHDLFDHDAIILYDMPRKVTLKSDLDPFAIEVEFADMKYCAFWHRNRTDAPYICIEPWTSLPGRQDVVEDITTNPTLLSLQPGESKEHLITYKFSE